MKKRLLSFAAVFMLILQLISVTAAVADDSVIKTEAEGYDSGGQNVGYYDTTSGMLRPIEGYSGDVDLAMAGTGVAVIFSDTEWMKYTVDVPADGSYTLTASYALARATTLPVMEILSGGIVAASNSLEATGGATTYQEAEIGTVNLRAGSNELKIRLDGSGINFDYFTLTYSGSYVEYMGNENTLEAEAANENPTSVEMSGKTVVTLGETPISFTLNSHSDGVFTVLLDMLCVTESEISISLNDGPEITKAYKATDGENAFTVETVSNLQFSEGENVLKISGSGEVYIDTVHVNILKSREESGVQGEIITVNSVDYSDSLNTRTNTQLTKSKDLNGLGYMSFNAGDWAEYEIDVPKSGLYGIVAHGAISADYLYDYAVLDVYLNDSEESVSSGTLERTSTWIDYQPGSLGGFYMDEGTNTVRIKVALYATHFHKFTVEYLGDSFGMYAAYAGEQAVATGTVIPRGTDNILLHFTQSVDADSVNENTVKLESENENIPLDVSVSGKDVIVSVKKTLDYDTSYTVWVEGIADAVRYFDTISEKIVFTTGNDDITEGAAVENVASEIEYEDITVTGVMLSSTGIGIEGRTATLYDDGHNVLSEAITEENGAFVIEYTMAEFDLIGTHNFTVGGEYVTEEIPISLVHISRSEENSLLSDWENVSNGEDAKAVIEEYQAGLGISPDSDFADVPDSDKVYELLAEETPASAEELVSLYRQYIFMETVNQATDEEVIKRLVSDGAALLNVGADTAKYAALSNSSKNAFVTDLLSCDAERNREKFVELLNDVLDNVLAAQYGKEGLVLTADVNTSVFVGQGVEIPLGFTEKRTGMTKAVFELSGEGTEYFNGLKTELDEDVFGEIDVVKEDGIVKVTYVPRNSTVEVSNIGVLKFLMGEIDVSPTSFDILMDGYAEYDEGIECDIKEAAEPKSVTLVVSVNTSKPSRDDSYIRGGSSGIGSGGNGSSFIEDDNNKDQTDNPDTADKKFEFIDISDVSWAQESINTLLAKGIISESEDAKFHPNNNVKREEFVKMMVLALGIYDENAETSFGDADKNAWYYSYVASAQNNGMVNGDENGNFKVGEDISREEMTAIVWRMLAKMEYTSAQDYELFDDDGVISEYAREAVYSARMYGIVNGMGDNMFEPKGTVTRAMAAKVVFEMMKMAGGLSA